MYMAFIRVLGLKLNAVIPTSSMIAINPAFDRRMLEGCHSVPKGYLKKQPSRRASTCHIAEGIRGGSSDAALRQYF